MQEIAIKYMKNILLGTHHTQESRERAGSIVTPLYYFHPFKKIRKFTSSFAFEITAIYF